MNEQKSLRKLARFINHYHRLDPMTRNIVDAHFNLERQTCDISLLSGEIYDEGFKQKINNICASLPYKSLDTILALKYELLMYADTLEEARENIERRYAEGKELRKGLE